MHHTTHAAGWSLGLLLVAPALGAGPASTATAVAPTLNTLSESERAQGFVLLFDGRTSQGWHSAHGKEFPSHGWEIKDGVLSVLETGGAESRSGGDIITDKKYAAFDLRLEFKLSEGANSGVKYYVDPELNKGPGSSIGLEYQLLDDARHPDAKMGRDGNRTLASLYDLIPAAADKKVKPIGEWNEARIVSHGRHVEHWLNGAKVLEYERGTPEFRRLVAESKYKVWPNFGELPQGHILLQDHGNHVSFRNIRLLELKPE
jgi:3-keto-disaccharide hydrolase